LEPKGVSKQSRDLIQNHHGPGWELRHRQPPQCPDDQPLDPDHNDTPDNWIRGDHSNGMKPDFDHSPPRDKMRR
jgi:hypothetical protein